MTGPEHYRMAERVTERANEWLDADEGWRSRLSAEERLAHRNSDLAEAQVHATLALAAAVAQLDAIEGPNGGSATGRAFGDWTGWHDVGVAS